MGKPVILRTGKSKLSDVDRAMDVLTNQNDHKPGILHCISAYPTPLGEVNLSLLQTYETLYDCVPGFSDHTEVILAPTMAVALGAKIVEKHFTLDKNDYGPDHWFSMDPDELILLVSSIRSVESMMGDG